MAEKFPPNILSITSIFQASTSTIMEEQGFKELTNRIGKRVLELRTQKEMSQSEFCALCNIDKREVQRLEKGQASPTIRTIYKITKGVEINFVDFFNFEEEIT